MIDDVIDLGSSLILWDLRLTIVATFLALFAATQLITSVQSNVALKGKTIPPVAPYAIPGLGNLISFAFDTEKFLTSIV